MKAFGFNNFLRLQINSFCVISDSGSLGEESKILGFPAITSRLKHERPESIENGNMVLWNPKVSDELEDIIKIARELASNKCSLDNSLLNLSSRITAIVLGYKRYINCNYDKKEMPFDI